MIETLEQAHEESGSWFGSHFGGYAGEPLVAPSAAQVNDLGASNWSVGIGLVPLSGAGMHHDLEQHWSVDFTIGWDN